VDPRAGLDEVEKRKFLTLPGLELRPLGCPAQERGRRPSWSNLRRTSGIRLVELRQSTNNLRQDSRCLSRDSNACLLPPTANEKKHYCAANLHGLMTLLQLYTLYVYLSLPYAASLRCITEKKVYLYVFRQLLGRCSVTDGKSDTEPSGSNNSLISSVGIF
jgi:hypothetical protein